MEDCIWVSMSDVARDVTKDVARDFFLRLDYRVENSLQTCPSVHDWVVHGRPIRFLYVYLNQSIPWGTVMGTVMRGRSPPFGGRPRIHSTDSIYGFYVSMKVSIYAKSIRKNQWLVVDTHVIIRFIYIHLGGNSIETIECSTVSYTLFRPQGTAIVDRYSCGMKPAFVITKCRLRITVHGWVRWMVPGHVCIYRHISLLDHQVETCTYRIIGK